MRYTCVDPAEFLYPDITEYSSGSPAIRILSPRSSYACAQIYFSGVEGDTLTIRCKGWSPEIYEMVAIPVEQGHELDAEQSTPFTPVRKAPFLVYDCLKPSDGTISVKEGTCAVYFSLPIPADAAPGTISASVIAGDITIPVELEISSAVVPDETLTMIVGYDDWIAAKYHGISMDSPEFDDLDTAYLLQLRRMRQNMLYCPKPRFTALGNNRYTFDFSDMESFMEKAISLGYTKFNYGLGFRKSWQESTILVDGMPSMSFECYNYLAQLLPALVNFLDERGWSDKFILGIADEPNNANATEYRALCGLVRKLAPSLKLLDAMSFGPVHGAVDIWIPLNSEYQDHQQDIDVFRKNGDTIWFYDCCGPRGRGFINRFMDYPLLATRYHFWAGYHFDLPGYLHWAANRYQPGQDPFKQSCPEHHNADSVCYLPAGDTHIMYPGDGEPWMSVRLEAMRASAEEYEMLRTLSLTDKTKADQICHRVCRSFNDVDYDPNAFRAARNALIRAMEAL